MPSSFYSLTQRIMAATLLALLPALVWAQATPTPNRVDGYGAPSTTAPTPPDPSNHGETEVNILSSYYQQDGDHGAVQGGRGTQYLTDLTPTIILNVPLDSVTRVSANVGVDYYASASTDRIDQVLSSPSAHDARYHVDLGYSRQLADKRTIVGVGGGFSKEYDYLSFNITGSWAHASLDGNRELSVAGQAFFDRATLILPAELRTGGGQEHGSGFDTRQSFNLNLVYSQVLTQRLQLAISTELVAQRGLLSTPFHRVYFRETGEALGKAKTERLPRQRYKYPVGLRLNYYATDLVQLRGYYRFYNDNFGITAHTLELETPVKVTPFFVLYPFYRYHTQTAANYFAPYLEHSVFDEFYTSDYDLAGFSAHKAGLGLRYSPVYGLGRFKTPFGGRVAKFKALDLRYAYYRQTTGLTANLISADLSFTMP
ncbi:DUF3570 domain-containing protein [Hymenobacter taeanensis]|uniref:DUF3570 domain-containing protein n=1 Tax=Hymenobacter taeanensis TaxID=2735321 RepID=A0A6M6BBU5_9BACT|nr:MULTISPECIES: DUF3570 domain-containing protein [Hymenobacter]QJX45676.1 DUF3570 domain-containing protein [Hymenobacter taeanensis]UOQ79512.1 DUF3570 domain-containing protein [Hymenobacter sp. 5414T-23]